MRWIFLVVVYIQVSVIQGECPHSCECTSGSDVCERCAQWYVWLKSYECQFPISIGPFDFETRSIPEIESSTKTSITGTFSQTYSGNAYTQTYYYYVLQYKTSQDSSYTDGTLHIQNTIHRNTLRKFVIERLQKKTEYEIRTVLYRGHNGIYQQLAVTDSITGSTACSDESKPTGVYASPGQESFTVHWENLFSNPSCEDALVDVHFRNVDIVAGLGESRRIPDADVANNPGSYVVTNVQTSSYNVFIKVNTLLANSSSVLYSDTVSVNVTDAPHPSESPIPSTNDISKVPTTLPTNDKNHTPLAPVDNNPTPLPTDDNKVIVPLAILSVIILVLVVLLVVSLCYNVKWRRRIQTDRVSAPHVETETSHVNMPHTLYYNSTTGEAVSPSPMTGGSVRGMYNSATREAVSPSPMTGGSVRGMYNSATREAVSPSPMTGGSVRGMYNSATREAVSPSPMTGGSVRDGSLYEEVAGRREDTYSGYEEPQDSSYEAMRQQPNYRNLPAPPAVYQEI